MDGDIATIGITDHAQDALTDIVYIELPEGGEMLDDMGEFAIVESVKSASPIFAPLAGEITEVNMDLEDTPELMNTSPYGDGWIACVQPFEDLSRTMTPDQYQSMLDSISD